MNQPAFHRMCAALLLLLAAACAAADSTAPPAGTAATHADEHTRTQALYDLDPYYSDLALQVPLTDSPIPVGGQLSEADVYRRLFQDSLRPRVLLLEASVYPLPVAGTWLKSNHPGFYNDFNYGPSGHNQLNLLDGVTAGFQEPWAVSAFTGSTMRFTSEDSGSAGNRGYMGYLTSFGTKQIHNNTLIDDNWWEFEWKLKGERNFADEKLGWSFRIGIKNNSNANIRDVIYIGLRRSNLEYTHPLLSFLDNSDLELLTEFDRLNSRLLRQEITIGRKFPLRGRHMAFGLDMGLIYENPDKFTGPLADSGANTVTVVLRPNLEF